MDRAHQAPNPSPREAAGLLRRARYTIERLASTTARMARGRHGSLAMLGVWMIGIIFLIAAIGYGLTLRAPSWFQSKDRSQPEMRLVAQKLENRLITEAYRFRGGPTPGPAGSRRTGDDWRIRVTEDEATAWLSVKLAEWLANRDPPLRMPRELSELQAHFGSGRAAIAGLFDERVYTASAAIRTNESGLWVSGARAGVGSLTLPVSWGGTGLVGVDDSRTGGLIWRVFSGQEPLLPGGTFRLEDGRRIRVIAVRVLTGAIEVECRTEVP